MNQGGNWLSVLGITVANTIWGSSLFVLFCTIGIIYLGNQTYQSVSPEHLYSWTFLKSFVVVLGRKLGILGTSSIIASLLLVTTWELGRTAKEAIVFRLVEQMREKERAKERDKVMNLIFDRLEQDPNWDKDARDRIQQLKSELQITTQRD